MHDFQFTLRLPTAAACFSLVTMLAGSVTAQATRVWPIGYQSTRGDGAMAAPFSIPSNRSPRAARAVTTYSAATLPFGAGTVIDEIAFRRDARDSASYAAHSGTCEVRIGVTSDAMDPSGNAAQIIESELRVVYSGTLSLPAASAPSGSGAAGFQIVIPFATPWTYPGGDIAIEIYFSGTAGRTWRRDAVEPPAQVDGEVHTRGRHGLVGSHGYEQLAWAEADRAVPGGELRIHLEGAPPTRPYGAAINLLGTSMTTSGGRSLPVALPSPEFPAGAFLGIDAVNSQLQLTGDHGDMFARALARWPIPAVASLTGVVFTSQWLVLDPLSNARLPLLTSNVVEIELGAAAAPRPFEYGRTAWRYQAPQHGYHGLELGPPNYVPITRFGGTFAP